MATLIAVAAYVALFALLLAAAVGDIRTRTISNRLVIAIVALWAAFQMALLLIGATYIQAVAARALEALAFGAALLALTVAYESLRHAYAFGGGDVKLVSAVTLFVGIEPMAAALVVACAVGILYATAGRRTVSANGIPFAPCVAAGVVALLIL